MRRPRRTWSAEAGHFGPQELKRLGRGLLEVVAPEIADEAEYQRLVAEEKRSRAETRLNIRDRGDGSSDITARIPTPVAHRFKTYLDAYTSPRRNPLGDVDQLPAPRRRGEAFCALLENLPVNGLPKHGGTATSVMVILDLDTLQTDAGCAETSTGDRITAEQARRLACQAGIIPVVLGGKGEILDLGRARRFFSPAQRKAMELRDRHCTAHGCDMPAAYCEAHHFTTALVQGRQDRPRRRQAPVPLPPPPRPRPRLGDPPPAERLHELPPADVRVEVPGGGETVTGPLMSSGRDGAQPVNVSWDDGDGEQDTEGSASVVRARLRPLDGDTHTYVSLGDAESHPMCGGDAGRGVVVYVQRGDINDELISGESDDPVGVVADPDEPAAGRAGARGPRRGIVDVRP